MTVGKYLASTLDMVKVASPCCESLMAMFTLGKAIQHMRRRIDHVCSVEVHVVKSSDMFSECAEIDRLKIAKLAPQGLCS